MTNDGMTPVLTITDAPVAFAIAEALRAQADASRRTADRMESPAYASLASVNFRRGSALRSHANRLDMIAAEAERQGHALTDAESDADTLVLPFAL